MPVWEMSRTVAPQTSVSGAAVRAIASALDVDARDRAFSVTVALYAAAGQISDDNFMNGIDHFTGVTGEVMHVDSGYHVVGMIKTSSATQLGELLADFKD